MIEKVVHKHDLNDPEAMQRDREYWLSRPPEERIAAVDFLRQQTYGPFHKMQKVVRILTLSQLRAETSAD